MSIGFEQMHIGRQPILDRKKNLFAFELFFRGKADGISMDKMPSDESSATAAVISVAFNELGVENILGPCNGFINLNGAMLADEVIELLPKSKIVFEIMKGVQITDQVIERCQQLRLAGYRLALDDVADPDDKRLDLLKHINIIKINIAHFDNDGLSHFVDKIRARNHTVTFLAEKVEKIEQFEHCLGLGFDLFQGYFFARPRVITGQRMPHSKLVLLKILEQLICDADLHVIEKSIKENPALSINLLKIASSVGAGSRKGISSIKEAVTILGRRQLQRWVQLLVYINTDAGEGNKLSPLLHLAASRGRTMELIARERKDNPIEDHAFITGILSLLDAMFGISINDALNQIKISPHVVNALLKREGELGEMLQLIELSEQENHEEIQWRIQKFPYLTAQKLKEMYAESCTWSIAVSQGNMA